MSFCCISFDSYIKPQHKCTFRRHTLVVYLLIPTSNHNLKYDSTIIYWLYIFWFLHQTTTHFHRDQGISCCISFDSYIKPQLSWVNVAIFRVVYLLIPTSNHNSLPACALKRLVVYLLIPTSNHNHGKTTVLIQELYIFWFLHQTTTCSVLIILTVQLYIFWFLHQTTTRCQTAKELCELYIFWFLHQTTTWSIA